MLLTFYQSAHSRKELKALLRLSLNGKPYAPPKDSLSALAYELDDKAFCYAALGKVSRSFAAVIQQLPEHLQDTVCLFYLVLRALDTIEDDMCLPLERKLQLLRDFHRISKEDHFHLTEIGDQIDYKVLLVHYQKVRRTLETLDPGHADIIDDISRRMGEGMAKFAERRITTLKDFNEYCHYVAGLVGIGLTRLFKSKNPNALTLANADDVSNSMGLFLQKTNIIRDYHEDLHSERLFWPEEIWKLYADNLRSLSFSENRAESIACLDHLITDALTHVPDCLAYMRSIRDERIFRFASVPQVMAIANLSKMFQNPKVFSKSIKVRKGLAARLLMYPISMRDVNTYFYRFLRTIEKKNLPELPNYQLTATHLAEAKKSLIDYN